MSMATDPVPQCDIRGCVGVGSYQFLETDADLKITEQVDICDRHARILQIERQDDDGAE